MTQRHLFPVVSDQQISCAHGLHAPLVDDAPELGDVSVQVVRRCPACRRAVGLTSYTREAWDAEQAKQQTKASR